MLRKVRTPLPGFLGADVGLCRAQPTTWAAIPLQFRVFRMSVAGVLEGLPDREITLKVTRLVEF